MPVHPWFDHEVSIMRNYGPDAVCVEGPDGRLAMLPTTWTDLKPRVLVASLCERQVRLAPEAVAELAQWVQARRIERPSRKKLARFDIAVDKRNPDGTSRRSVPNSAENAGARDRGRGQRCPRSASVVEQAGAPNVDRRSRGQRRRGATR
jgi:hypothetical protein